MKQVIVLAASMVFLLVSWDAFPWGVVTHMTILDDILKDPRLDSEIKRILEENMAYAKGGVSGPDMFYADVSGRYGDMTHYYGPGGRGRRKLELHCEEAGVCFLPISALSWKGQEGRLS